MLVAIFHTHSCFPKGQIIIVNTLLKERILPQEINSQIKMKFLTVADVAAESNGNIPPQAMIMLSIT